MDFGALPPEINSARMYAGPGSESMLAAATAWNGLAAELHSAASVLRIGDFGVDRRIMDGSIVDSDGGRGGALCGVDERHRRAG